jgi:hypothetical protein
VPSPDDFLPSMGGLNGTVAAFAASLAALAAFASCTSGKKTFFFYHSASVCCDTQ